MSICLIQGHPHDDSAHFCHALADAYAEGARSNRHDIERLTLSRMDIPLLRNPEDFMRPPPGDILDAQKSIREADHLVVIYPLWLGSMPAMVKAFFEQLARNEFAIAQNKEGGWPRKMLKGKSARVIVTMGMPGPAYRFLFGAHGLKSFEGGILGMAGFKPIRDTLIGGVGNMKPEEVEKHLSHMHSLGKKGD